MDNPVLGIAFFSYFVFMFSTVCHEAGHAIAARLGGDSTAYLNGQVTLNPVPHIRQEPFGLGLLPLITLLTSLEVEALASSVSPARPMIHTGRSATPGGPDGWPSPGPPRTSRWR